MQKELLFRLECLKKLNKDEILREVEKFFEEYSEHLSAEEENARKQAEIARQFQEMKLRAESAERENTRVMEENLRLTEQLQLSKRDLYGRSTENTEDILGSAIESEKNENPIEEQEIPVQSSSAAETTDNADKVKHLMNGSKKERHKRKGKRKDDLARLPKKSEFHLPVEELDQQYGKGNWGIRFWTEKKTIESVRSTKYLRCVYEPVISVGLEHECVRVTTEDKLLPHSLVSRSLMAEIMYNRCTMALPFYRQEKDLERDGVIISRTSMSQWCSYFATELFSGVYKYLCSLQTDRSFSQSDETTLRVINDGRKAGAVSYVWVHTTSELDPEPPIIIFCYELTRNTQHLREYYLKSGFVGFIVSDAYCSYGLLEKESNGTIVSCGCFMHARRRFAKALIVMNLKDMTEDAICQLPEFIVLVKIQDIYAEDTPLKQLSAEERLAKRQEKLRPLVDDLFSYIHSLQDNWIPSYSAHLLDAVNYTLKNETQLRRFLDDPMIPLDNGFAERSIRTLAVGRHNWLFNSSIEGAEASVILYSLEETAKANGAHPYYYFKYLLDKLPTHMSDNKSKDYLPDMTPWSEAYREYEIKQKQDAVAFWADPEPVTPPKAPKQNRRPLPVDCHIYHQSHQADPEKDQANLSSQHLA